MDFDVKDYIYGLLKEGSEHIGFLSTVDNEGNPDVVALSFFRHEQTLICGTDKMFNHSKNLDNSKKVSVAFLSGVTVKGRAEITGSVHSNENAYIRDIYKTVMPGNWSNYSCVESQIFLCVRIESAKVWRYISGIPYQAKYDFVTDKQTVSRYNSNESDECN